jgi:hypothetical protein
MGDGGTDLPVEIHTPCARRGDSHNSNGYNQSRLVNLPGVLIQLDRSSSLDVLGLKSVVNMRRQPAPNLHIARPDVSPFNLLL